MQKNWQTFLQSQGATILEEDLIEFDHPDIDISKTPLLSPLSGFALLAVSGEDRHAFLHGQFTNDLNMIANPAGQLSAWCNARGQVITNFLIINTGISYLLIFKQTLQAFVQKRLSMFVLRSKVTIEDVSETSALVGIANSKSLSLLAPNTPDKPDKIIAHEELMIICHPDNSGRYLIFGHIDALKNKVSELKNKLTLVSSSAWNQLDILTGLPWITAAIREQFLPQMLNLDYLNSLSYQKGCYPGQEVIARLHYRGEVKKRLQLIQSDTPLKAGEQIKTGAEDANVGIVINSMASSGDVHYALAIIELNKLKNTLSVNEKPITLLELPYARQG